MLPLLDEAGRVAKVPAVRKGGAAEKLLFCPLNLNIQAQRELSLLVFGDIALQ